jgi:signal transduction histidine kinase
VLVTAGVGEAIASVVSSPVTAVSLAVLPLLAVGTTLPVGLLWSQPGAAALVVVAAAVLSLAGFHALTVAGLIGTLVACHRFGRTGLVVPAVLCTVPFPVLALIQADARTVAAAALAPAMALAGAVRQARAEASANTAAHQVMADTLLAHTARGERARIARELHDVVAHHISMVAVQAETARVSVPGMPAAGAERLSAIGDTARAALTEMRRLLGVLREDADTPSANRAPQPGLRLAELNDLIDEARDASGSCTRLVLSGAPVALDPGVELAAYRIVQEALTNARRHAPGAAVDVELHYTGDALRLLIRDNGPGPPAAAPAGHGLSGMRERAAAVGGDLSTGPAPGGGFLVAARLPGGDEAAR